MTINIFQGNEPIGVKGDVNVIIDVIRAFTTAHVAFKKGIKKIFLVNEVEHAMAIRKENEDIILVGEINAYPIPGFDFTNSPYALETTELKLEGKELVQKTTNGVKSVLNNLDAEYILVTGFSNVEPIIAYIQSLENIHTVNLIASHPTGDEDLACAEYIKAKLNQEDVSIPSMMKRVKNCEAAQKFYTKEMFDEEDINMAAQIDPKAKFVMEVQCQDNLPFIEKVYLENE